MTKSTFANSNGLPDPGNKMTVRELAKLARHIILTYPEFYKLFGEKEFTWNKIRQQNRNPLLNSLEGADGLKTGYTKEGGYGMVGSAVQNGMRLIVVVNGLEDPEDRASEAKKMLEWGFRNFEVRTLFAAQQPVGYAKVFGGDSRSVKLSSPEPIKVMVQKNGTDKLIARVVYTGPVRAPIAAGQQVGVVRVWRGANLAMEAPVYAAESVGKGSTMRRAIDGVSELVIGMFRARRREALRWPRQRSNELPGADVSSPSRAARGPANPRRSRCWPIACRPRNCAPSSPASPADRRGPKSSGIWYCPAWASCWAPEAETLLFAAARDDHVRTVIKPALNQGIWVLCDRFSDSTRAYQGSLGKVAPAILNAMERVTIGDLKPDLTIILDVPVEVGMQRAAAAPRQRRARPVRGGRPQISPGIARRLPADRSGRAGALRADRRRPPTPTTVAANIWAALRDRFFAASAGNVASSA